jgi:hypothetical protein
MFLIDNLEREDEINDLVVFTKSRLAIIYEMTILQQLKQEHIKSDNINFEEGVTDHNRPIITWGLSIPILKWIGCITC